MGFEPTTPSLGSWYSTTELRPLNVSIRSIQCRALFNTDTYHRCLPVSSHFGKCAESRPEGVSDVPGDPPLHDPHNLLNVIRNLCQ